MATTLSPAVHMAAVKQQITAVTRQLSSPLTAPVEQKLTEKLRNLETELRNAATRVVAEAVANLRLPVTPTPPQSSRDHASTAGAFLAFSAQQQSGTISELLGINNTSSLEEFRDKAYRDVMELTRSGMSSVLAYSRIADGLKNDPNLEPLMRELRSKAADVARQEHEATMSRLRNW